MDENRLNDIQQWLAQTLRDISLEHNNNPTYCRELMNRAILKALEDIGGFDNAIHIYKLSTEYYL